MLPEKISVFNKDELVIKWKGGSSSGVKLIKLRQLCPCAECIRIRDSLKTIETPIIDRMQYTVLNIEQVGTYAISIKWKDGHSTGIYEYPYLKKIAG